VNNTTDCITNPPLFVDAANGDYHLRSGSPCIDSGANSWVTTTTDMDGNPRIINHIVDMGAYEFQQLLPPFFFAQPASQTTHFGGAVSLTAVIGGTPPVSCQWQFNNAPITGATNLSLTLDGVQLGEEGDYTLVMSNEFGSITSSVVVVTATNTVAPGIASQPASQTASPGGTSTFSVAASGTGPFSYCWQFDGTNIADISGGTITTVAGNGIQGFSGDGGWATNAGMFGAAAVAVDAKGQIFIADSGNNRIRKVDVNGIMATFAGNGSNAYSGDGGTATNAGLYSPQGVAADNSGNLFIADFDHNCIRKVDTNGIITTLAGNGTWGYSGDGGPAVNSMLRGPTGLSVDAVGNLFIVDTYNYMIRKIATNGIITRVAGNGTSGYSGDGAAAINASLTLPSGVAVDNSGNVFIADVSGQRVRKVATNGIITTVVGTGIAGFSGDGGPATNALLNDVCSVVVDAPGVLLIADAGNYRVRQIKNGIITTIAGTGAYGNSGDGGPAINASFTGVGALATDAAGDLLFVEGANAGTIREVRTQQSLVLTGLTATNAGNYDVIVTSPYGSMTSSVVTLTVAWPAPVLQALTLANGVVSLTWSSVAGQSYQVQYTPSLTPPNWQYLSPAATATGPAMTATDPAAATAQRFYRVVLLP